MEYISKFIYDYSINNKVANESFIKDIFDMFLTSQNINEKYNVQLANSDNCTFFIRYYPSKKSVMINFKSLLIMIYNIVKKHEDLSSTDKVLLFNLILSEIERHEIEHIIQDIKMNNEDSTFSNILIKSNEYENILKTNDKYDLLKYRTNPIERDAKLKSLFDIYLVTIFYENNKIIDFFKNDLLSKSNEYYDDNLYPAYYFFDSKINEIDNYENLPNKDKLFLGLKIKEES